MKNSIICDIDGTLSNCDHRVNFILSKDYDSFHGLCSIDQPYEPVVKILHMLEQFNYNIVLLTGRNEKYRAMTMQWLTEHDVPHNVLLMRDDLDHSKDIEMKWNKAILHFGIDICNEVLFVLEDRDQVVQMWRDKGLTCLQPRLGDY